MLEPAGDKRGDGQKHADDLVYDGARREADAHGQAHEDVAHNALRKQREELAQRVYEAVWFIAEERDP